MPKERRPQIVALTSEKGGVGKSTLAVHLAGALAARGLRVALVDEDGRVGSSLRWSKRAADHGGLGFPVLDAADLRPRDLAGHDLVLVDTEGRPRRRELRELADRADLIVLPSGVSPLEREATRDLADFLATQPDASRRLRVVLCRVPPVGRAGEDARQELRDAGITVCNGMIRHYAAYVRAAEHGQLVRDLAEPRAALAWDDVLTLSRELV